MKYISIIVIGYLLGSVNPAAFFAKKKNKNLREMGTGNLGATNAMLVLGKAYGAAVMAFDIFKSYLAFRIAQRLLPGVMIAGLLGGSAAVMGHMFPFYLKFKGGKGLASFGGLVLAYDPAIFVLMLAVALVLVFIVNYSVAMPMSAALLFPVLSGLRDQSVPVFLLSTAVCAVMAYKFKDNLIKARNGTDIKIREFLHRNEDEDEEKKSR